MAIKAVEQGGGGAMGGMGHVGGGAMGGVEQVGGAMPIGGVKPKDGGRREHLEGKVRSLEGLESEEDRLTSRFEEEKEINVEDNSSGGEETAEQTQSFVKTENSDSSREASEDLRQMAAMASMPLDLVINEMDNQTAEEMIEKGDNEE